MKEAFDFYSSQIGMQVHCPQQVIIISHVPSWDFPVNKWEKRRDEIVEKVKKRIWLIRAIIKSILATAILAGGLCGVLFLIGYVHTAAMIFSGGYLAIGLLRLYFLLMGGWWDYWDCDDVKFKHKGKIY